MITIMKSVADNLGFDLAAEVASFQEALIAHSKTVDVAAPASHPLVEDIVRNGGTFEIHDDTPPPPPPPEDPLPPPEIPAITYKADLWRRASDDEADLIIEMLEQQPKRMQRLFNDCQFLSHGDPQYLGIEAAFTAAFGEERTGQLLARSY